MTHQHHLQMGLRKGIAILIYYVVGETKFQAVLLAEDSVVGRGGKGENRLWKRVTPIVTEFAWLPPAIVESFCRNAWYRETTRTYHAFDIPHLGLETKRFDAYMRGHLLFGRYQKCGRPCSFHRHDAGTTLLRMWIESRGTFQPPNHWRTFKAFCCCSETPHVCPARCRCTD